MKKTGFTMKFVSAATPDQSVAIIKKILRVELARYFRSEGVIANNLNEVLDKYITVPANEQILNKWEK